MISFSLLRSVSFLSSVLSHGDDVSTKPTTTLSNTYGNVGIITWIIIYAALIVFLFILPIRSRKKKELEIKKMHDEITIGKNVLITGGLYGKIIDICNDVYIIEFGVNKGIRIPVNKGDVIDIKEADLTSSVIDKK